MHCPFGSALAGRILAYAFGHPGEEWHVRQLAALAEGDPGNVSRELRRLEREKIFLSRVKGNMKIYGLNEQYPLFKEMKAIAAKTFRAEGAVRELVAKQPGIALAFIHGSAAVDQLKSTSDIDLVVVGSAPGEGFLRGLQSLENRLNREINYTHYSQAEFARQRKKPGGFLALVLKGKKIMLKGGLDG